MKTRDNASPVTTTVKSTASHRRKALRCPENSLSNSGWRWRIPLVVFTVAFQCLGQGTLQITFDGPPVQPPGTAALVQLYEESGMWFVPIPGSDGFVRRGSSPREGWPDNGTAYLQASLGDSLQFGMDDGSEFGLLSVDLAEFSTLYQEPLTVQFVGYKSDGSTVTANLVTDGVIDGTGPLADFETLYFDSRFTGLTRVQIPTTGWCLDNLALSIPESGTWALLVLGGVMAGWRLFKRSSRR